MQKSEENTRSKGRRGEEAALSYLEELGLKFVIGNWYSGHLELDLVMEDDSYIRFIEVRSLEYPHVVEPFETINVPKQRRIIKAAGAFIRRHGVKKEAVFDVVSVVFFKNEVLKIEYIANAFTPLW